METLDLLSTYQIDDQITPETSTEYLPSLCLVAEQVLNQYVAYRLIDLFQNEGFWQQSGDAISVFELKQRLGMSPAHDRLTAALIDILARYGFIEPQGSRWVATALTDDPDIQQTIALFRESEGRVLARKAATWAFIAATIRLVNTCLNGLMDVLAGRRTYMEVMFPEGDMSLVSDIYKGTIQQELNQYVARTVRQWVEERLRRHPSATVQILEVGAGTGGTTAPILEELAPLGEHVTYWYTDIAAGFTRLGNRLFGAKYPFTRFKTLDVTRRTSLQGWADESIDLIICNNVLHATPNLWQSVLHLTPLLTTGGAMLVNDLTKRLDFNTVTFGLTPDWWNANDPADRIRHSPVLSAPQWKELFEQAGYTNVRTRGVPGIIPQESPQSVILATLNLRF